MKNIVNTITETLLITSFVTLLAIPVIVFGGFTPTVISPTVQTHTIARKDVLGAQTTAGEEVISYKMELLPTTTSSIVIEEAKKETDSYAMTIRAYNDTEGGKEEDLLRIVNTSEVQQTIVIQISDYYEEEHLDSLKLKIDDTRFSLSDLVEEKSFEPAVTLEPNEWLTIGIFIDDGLKEPTYITVTADIFAK